MKLIHHWRDLRIHFSWTLVGVLAIWVAVGVLGVGVLMAVRLADERLTIQRQSQQAIAEQLDAVSQRLVYLENENKKLAAEGEKAKAQANTSVDQLVKSGETPIISAPEVVTVPTTPVATTSTTSLSREMPTTTSTTSTTTTTEVPTTTTTSSTTSTTTTSTTEAPPPEETTTTTTEIP